MQAGYNHKDSKQTVKNNFIIQKGKYQKNRKKGWMNFAKRIKPMKHDN